MNRLNRLWLPALGLLALLLAVTPALSQDDNDWSAYVYSQAQQTLVRVDADGAQTAYPLGLGDSVALQGRHMAFWPDGNRVAYCAVTYGKTTTSTLFVRNLPSGENIVAVDFPNASDCRVTQTSLSADQSQLAVALFGYFPADTTADTTQPPWQIAVVDTETGDILHTLDGDDPLISEAGIDPQQAVIAETQRFSDDAVTFYAIPYAVGGSTFYESYRWDLSDGSLELDEKQAVYNVSTLPETGERVYATQDEALPFGVPNGPVPSNNVVLVETSAGEAYPIYHNPDWIIIDTDFIENGQRIAISLIPSADQPQTSAFAVAVRTIALDREGRISELVTTDGNLQVLGAPGGFIALMGSLDPTGTTRLMYGMGGQMRPLWQASGEAWELAWSAPTPAPSSLPPVAVLAG